MKSTFVPSKPMITCNSFYSLNSCCLGSERKLKYGDCLPAEKYGLVKGDSVIIYDVTVWTCSHSFWV